jgi:ribosome-binding factor A
VPSHRQLRVRELLKREIGEAIRREIPVHTAGLLTVNDVILSSDLRTARVFLGYLGSSEQQKAASALLSDHRVRIQDHVARTVILKYTPRLRFEFDDSVERGDRVLRLIEELEQKPPAE